MPKGSSPLRKPATLALLAIVLGVAIYYSSANRTRVLTHHAQKFDLSLPLPAMRASSPPETESACAEPDRDCGTSPLGADDPDEEQQPPAPAVPPTPPPLPPAAVAVEQSKQGVHPAAAMVASFDGLGVGFIGPEGTATGRNPSDNSLAVGPDHIVQIVNSKLAVFSKKGAKYDVTGKVLYGAVNTNTLFKGFGGPCEAMNNGDAVVRYDQLAGRWLYTMPIFRRIPDRTEEPYAMCYALSKDGDPLGPYYRYEFRRKLFPDYPRPAVWPDGYYNPTSTGDTVIQKHDCIADRAKMLEGKDATEQCLIIDGVNFLNNSDVDGAAAPPAGAPNIMIAAGGSQLRENVQDDGLYAWKVHVDWQNPKNTAAIGPVKIAVAPYHYLCGGQLTNCVPQPDTTRRLDAQGDKIMQRLIYRNIDGHESIVAVHSVYSSAGAGGVRWYELRLDGKRDPILYQQGTYAPDQFYRWMASPGMDRLGNIGIGYSFGGTPNYAGQRFAGRMAGDPLGQLTVHETVMATGAASQTYGNRWEDYASLAMDPSDDCTFWYVGDYYQASATNYSSRIGGFRMPGCLQATLRGSSFFDLNHNGKRDAGEPGLPGRQIAYPGGTVTTGADGSFTISVPSDPAYQTPPVTVSEAASKRPWTLTSQPREFQSSDNHVEFGSVCMVPNRGGAGAKFWAGSKGQAILQSHDPEWRNTAHVEASGDFKQSYVRLKQLLKQSSAASELAAAVLSVAYGTQDGAVVVHDSIANDWLSVKDLLGRVGALSTTDAARYRETLQKLNANALTVTPASPAGCR